MSLQYLQISISLIYHFTYDCNCSAIAHRYCEYAACVSVMVKFLCCLVADRWERSSNQNKWELTKPLPLDEHSTSIVELLGPKPDVHYIYVCVKVCHQQSLVF
jgi:hypothetical protein